MAGQTHSKATQAQAIAQGLQTALALRNAGRLADAEKICREILAVDPACFDALHLMALLALAQAKPTDALALIDQALRLNGGSADALANRASILMRLGRAEEALATCVRALGLAPRHVGALNNRGNAEQALGRQVEALASYDRALAVVPDHAPALVNRGNALQKLRRHAAALASYDAALAVDADNPDAWTHRGVALESLDRLDDALASHENALALDPRRANAWSHRATTLTMLGRPAEAIASADAALALDSDHASAWGNRGNALREVGRYDEARASCDRALALAPDHADLRFNDGILRLTMGDLRAGWESYERRWETPHAIASPWRTLAPSWSGAEPLAGKTILLFAEQGLGDTLQFIRFVPKVARMAARVALCIDRSLAALRLPLADNVTLVAADAQAPGFDLQCSLLSLPRALGVDLANMECAGAYLAAPADRVAAWAEWLTPEHPGKRIGLVWAGNPAHRNDRNRSIPLATLRLLLEIADIEFISLQRDLRLGDEALLRDHPDVRHMGAALADFADTAAVIAALDLVVTIDSSVAHLAGAMGKPVWIMLPFCADWRWLIEREDSPWYPSARLFRQPAIGDWESVIARISRELPAVMVD